jgi:hypothetical protein
MKHEAMIECVEELLERVRSGEVMHLAWLEQNESGHEFDYIGRCDPHRTRSLLQEMGDEIVDEFGGTDE